MDLLKAYRKMHMVRSAEAAIIGHYAQDGMKTPMHMSKGEEGIVVGVLEAAGEDAQALGTYRTHALYLAKTGDLEGFFAEMYGKATGRVKGKGGSMHLVAPDKGLIGTSAIVASCLPVAAGAAFANKTRGLDRIVVVFFGDGAVDEGVFWETINSACLMKLAVLFVYEDNGLAVHAPVALRHGYKDLAGVIGQFDCETASCDGYDVRVVHSAAAGLLARMKAASRPGFLSCKYFRFLEHVGIAEDFKAGYRARPAEEELRNLDPVARCREAVGEAEALKIEAAVAPLVQQALEAAEAAAFPDKTVAFEDLYS
jgi:TPP-dependent pyruvate/acetoin dehydrogenase alpha subunit